MTAPYNLISSVLKFPEVHLGSDPFGYDLSRKGGKQCDLVIFQNLRKEVEDLIKTARKLHQHFTEQLVVLTPGNSAIPSAKNVITDPIVIIYYQAMSMYDDISLHTPQEISNAFSTHFALMCSTPGTSPGPVAFFLQ